MKPMLTAVFVFFAGAIFLQSASHSDLVPSNLQAVLEQISAIW